MAMWIALIIAAVQAVVGDAHGLNTLGHQPAKIAAKEGHWENVPGQPTPLILVGWPDMKAEVTRHAIEIPYSGSIILTHSLEKQVPALKDFPPGDRPDSTVVFWTFRLMVGMGVLMILTGIWSLVLRVRGRLYTSRVFLSVVQWLGPVGLIALLAGWVTIEMGRQPRVVDGVMRTADASSPLSTTQVGLSLIPFVPVYFSLLGLGAMYMLPLVRKGPVTDEGRQQIHGGPGEARTPCVPFLRPGTIWTTATAPAHEGLENGY
jgi:cytochrome d ubiquinol oxidase subunit I